MATRKPKPKKVKAKNLVCTVISLIEREESRQETLLGLESIGLKPHVIELDPRDDARDTGNHYSNAQASAKALEYALENKSGLLFCEDDIQIGRHLAYFIDKAIEADEITYFYAHDLTSRLALLYDSATKIAIKSMQALEPRMVPVLSNRFLAFTQCVYIPFRHLEAFDIERIKEGGKSFDVWLQSEYIQKENILPLMALPHPVQHLQNREGRADSDASTHAYKRSLSFRG